MPEPPRRHNHAQAANTVFKAAFIELEDTPFNSSDRTFMIAAAEEAQKELTRRGVEMSVADIQAALWYYEKRLYAEMGARPSDTNSFLEAAEEVVAEMHEVVTTFNLSASTGRLAGLAKLTAEAADGDTSAAMLLNEILRAQVLHSLSGIDELKVAFTPVLGVYGGTGEPSLRVDVRSPKSKVANVVAALARVGENLKQSEVHARQNATAGTKAGHNYKDGSYNAPFIRVHLTRRYTQAEVDALTKKLGIAGLSVEGVDQNILERYYVGNPRSKKSVAQFLTDGRRLARGLGGDAADVRRGLTRLWRYGPGGAIPYGSVRGASDVAPRGDANPTARRLASRYRGREIVVEHAARRLTPEQVALQTSIAEAFEAMPLDDLGNPQVQRAYAELAAELQEQFTTLPAAVEVWTGDGQPYANSAAMRRDVVDNNHLFIFATSKEGFGPAGADYSNHPLLAATSFTDVNGRALLVNDLLRALHDYYAHTMTPNQFGPLGEENAWRAHMLMTKSPWARWALTSETRGQNSWVNFGPHGESNRTNPASTVFSEQKTALLPIEFAMTGDPLVDAEMDGLAQPAADKLTDRSDLPAGWRDPGDSAEDGPDQSTATPEELAQDEAELRRLWGPLYKEHFEQGGTLKAGEGKVVRGFYNPATGKITLTKDANSTTLFHELGHHFLSLTLRLASQPTASPRLLAEAKILLDWFRVPGATVQEQLAAWNAMTLAQQEKSHESFAYNWEDYLFTGKAPTIALEGMFRKFSRWIRDVARGFRARLQGRYTEQFPGDALPDLTPEVRGVMERMLASEDAITHAISVRNLVPLFQTQAQYMKANPSANVEELKQRVVEWEAYRVAAEAAREDAIAALTRDSLRQMQWLSRAKGRVLKAMQAQHKVERERVRAEIATEVAAEPVRRAIRWLAKGEVVADDGTVAPIPADDPTSENHKLDTEQALAMLAPGTDPARLKSVTKAGGLNPDHVAEAFGEAWGFTSGEQLVREIANTLPIDEEIDARTDERMLTDHADIVAGSPEHEASVESALHNEARQRFVAAQLRHLQKTKQPARLLVAAAKSAAEQIIAGKRVREISPHEHVAAEARASREAMDALKKGDLAAVTDAVRKQLVQAQLVLAATDVRAEIDKALDAFKKFGQKDAKLAKGRNVDLVATGRAILASYGLGRSDKLPLEHLEQVRAYDPDSYARLLPMVTAAVKGNTLQDYRDLTLTEFRDLRDTVNALWFLAKREHETLYEGQMVADEIVTGKMLARFAELPSPEVLPGTKQAVTKLEVGAGLLGETTANHTRPEHMLQAMDGGTPGVFTKAIWRRIHDAVGAYKTARNTFTQRYHDLISALDLPSRLHDGQTADEKRAGTGIDYRFTKAELLGALLHTGNESNLRKLLLGRKWAELVEVGDEKILDTTRWDAFISRMYADGVITEKDIAFVRAVWKLTAEMKPMAQEAHHQMLGFYFKEVKTSQIVTPWGTFEGGYVPARTDEMLVPDAKVNAMMSQLENGFREGQPSTGMGFAIERVENYTKALTLDLGRMAGHIDDVARFSHVQPAIRDVMRLMNNPKVKAAWANYDPAAYTKVLLPWLARTARQITTEIGTDKIFDKLARAARAHGGLMSMFWNFGNALQNPTGLLLAAVRVKPRYLARGVMRAVGSIFTGRAADEIRALSPQMAERFDNDIHEFREGINDFLKPKGVYGSVQNWFRRNGYFLQRLTQHPVDVATWWGAYYQAIDAQGADVDAADANREAVAQADAAVTMTQGSTNPEDVSAYEVGSPAWKAVIQFTSYFNNAANLVGHQTAAAKREHGLLRGMPRVIAIAALTGTAFVLADAIARLANGKEWDDEDDDGFNNDVAWWAVGSLTHSAVRSMPLGPYLDYFGSKAVGAQAGGRMPLPPALAALDRIVGSLSAVDLDDEQKMGRNVRTFSDALSLITGIPFSAVGSRWGYQPWCASPSICRPESRSGSRSSATLSR